MLRSVHTKMDSLLDYARGVSKNRMSESIDDRNYIKHSKPKQQSKGSLGARSDYAYEKQNKIRGLRRKADRASNHRRRQMMREEIQQKGAEAQPLASTTCTQRRREGGTWGNGTRMPHCISNRKETKCRAGGRSESQ